MDNVDPQQVYCHVSDPAEVSEAIIHLGKTTAQNRVSAALLVHVSGGPSIGGMDGAGRDECWVARLCASPDETLIRDIGRRRRRRAGRRSGLQEGV